MGYDAMLHLLDRQIVDADGMLVGKVDDLELVEDVDGALVATGLLVGMAALVPRFGDRLFRWWVRLAPAHAERRRPGAIDFDLVDEVTSEVHLSVAGDGLLRRRPEELPGPPTRRTLGQLLALPVAMADSGRELRVLDVRLDGAPCEHGSAVVGFLVGRGRPGSLLGYERSSDRGPWLVAAVVRRLHRHSRLVRLGTDVDIDWSAGRVRVGPGADVGPPSGREGS